MGMSGCMSEFMSNYMNDYMIEYILSTKTNKAEKMKNIALDYLNENYDDSFTALGYEGESWAYDYATVSFNSQKYNEMVKVEIYDENGTYSCKDNYFKLAMKEDAESFFTSIVTKYGYNAEVKVRLTNPELPEGLANNATFSEYIASGKGRVFVYFITNASVDKNDINSILTEIFDNKICGIMKFIVTDDADLLSQYSIDEMIDKKSESILESQKYTLYDSIEFVE